MVRSEIARRLAALVAVSVTAVACSQLAGIDDAEIIGETAAREAGAMNEDGPTGPPIDERKDANIEIALVSGSDFGDVPCQTESSPPRLISIHNKALAATTYKVVLPDGTAFRIPEPLEGPIAAGATVTLQLFAKPSTANENATDIVISAGNAVLPIRATVRGIGATFNMLPTLVSFGDVRMQSGGGPIDVEISNTGNAALSFSAFDTSPDFEVKLDVAQLKIEPESTGIVHAFLKGAASPSSALTTTLKPVLSQGLCGLAPVLTLTGKRVDSSVVLGSGDFGKQYCTPQANPRDITITNYSTSPLSYTTMLQASSAFTILSGGTGSIAAAPSASAPTAGIVRVQPNAFGTNLGTIAENLTINISGIAAPEGGTRIVPLKVDVRGAIVNVTPSALTGFVSDGTTTQTKTFNVQNSGNEIVVLNWTFAQTVGSSAWGTNVPGSVGAGKTRQGSVDFKPLTSAPAGNYEASLTPKRGAGYVDTGFFNFVYVDTPVCNAPLPQLTLSGSKP